LNIKGFIFILTALVLVSTKTPGQTLNFDFGSRNYGWHAVNNCEIEENDSYLQINIKGNDPQCMSPGNLKIDASAYKKIKIKLSNHTSPVLDIFWASRDDPRIRPEACQRSILSSDSCDENHTSLAQNQFIEYTIDLSNHKEWKGSIYKLRIDPGDGPDPKNMKDGKILKEEYLLIEYIKFVP